jgi:HEXXH motif-containing protein
LTQALDLLKEHLPQYFDWVVRIIRRVAVVHFERNVLYSGSHEHQYGTIHISDNSRVLSLAEMLIHEASHQYFELLNKLGPTVDPGHTELYYSPVKKCDRPLHKILFAYHAFANVMLFYRGVAECGLADSCSAKFQNVLNDELRQLEQPLLENDAILPIGRALVEPLIERSVCQ